MNSNGLRQSTKNILEMTPKERSDFLNSFDFVFSDCDGVIWNVMPAEPIPGVSKGIEFLKSNGKQVIYVTNNSLRPITEQIERFHKYGIEVKQEDIMFPAQSIVDYLKQINFQGLIYCLACGPFKDHLRNTGFELLEGPNVIGENLSDFAKNLFDNHPVKAVVMDVDFNLSAVKLMKAHLYLKKDPNCLLIGGAADPLLSFGRHELIGNGPFINVVEESSKKKAKILGKPGLELIELLKEKYNIKDMRRVLFVGDSIHSDVRFGKAAGFQTLAVLTGGAKLSDFENCDSQERPDFYVNSMADFSDFL